MLGLVLADPRDEESRPPSCAVNRSIGGGNATTCALTMPPVRLVSTAACTSLPNGTASMARTPNATVKSERIGRRKRPEYSVCDGQGAAADKGDQQPGREVTRRREERLHDDDDHDQSHGGAERFG